MNFDRQWGLDHGTWSVLRHIYPQAQVPVIQLSLDLRKSAEEHFRLGQQLAALRNEGILMVGSGHIVHNIAAFNWQNSAVVPPDWAVDFEGWNRGKLLAGETAALVDYRETGRLASLAVPTPDHYLPLLYIAALKNPADKISFPVAGLTVAACRCSLLSLAKNETCLRCSYG
ncbi:MAG: class III extradiol ring-cleavage dioxygenase [Desulfuromusa sp.]|nr:class III extradiol ring-cleavage dioxygenase [Desulfuromusa sp.]